LPVDGNALVKQTNEITMAIPLLDALDIRGKDITGDTLLTQRKLAHYLVEERQAHDHFTVKGNQPKLQQAIADFFQGRQEPDGVEHTPPDHGRIETRKISLNHYLDFPQVGQAFVIERECLYKKSGKRSLDIAYGITSRSPEDASAQRLLQINRGHWSIENSCHYILDWCFDEDRCRIRKGYGPENITRLRRCAISIIKLKGVRCVTEKMRELNRNTRLVFDYLRMTKNACAAAAA
jgi:predicted transposase YbfD/YdcC